MAEFHSEQQIRDLVTKAVDAALGNSRPQRAEQPGTAGPERSDKERTLALGADHGGFELKETLAAFLREEGWAVQDCGCFSRDAVDYPDLAHEVAMRVANGSCAWGIVVDGAGIGSAMAANKVPGVRAALCYDLSSARNSREHNHANVLTLGAGLIGPGLARQIVQTWLQTPWGGGRHGRRVDKISEVERRYSNDRGVGSRAS